MKRTGAELIVYALEQIGVKYTFGIPGVHNTEIYDQLNSSAKIAPILVTHEGGAAFMAVGLSASSDSIGTLVTVPAAGTTNAMSGIGEAYLDGIPLLIISGGTRRDTGKSFQLHQLNQENLVKEITKAYFLIEKHEDIIPTIYKAYKIATSGEPGPVFVEIPVEIQMFKGEISSKKAYKSQSDKETINIAEIKKAAQLLATAQKPSIYAGWGAAGATEYLIRIADKLAAPVATTLQGKASFPASHPLHTGFGFGANAVPAGQKAFADSDVMLAVGVRFSEIGTGSFGAKVPENLIHIDINPNVFNKNYPAKITIEGDAKEVLRLISSELEVMADIPKRDKEELINLISKEKQKYLQSWKKKPLNDKVSPAYFFESLQKHTDDNTYMVVDDGKHTYLAAELFNVEKSTHFISPTDFNCMGFCVPAAIGVKFMHPDNKVVGIVGDGAFLMTGLEALTAHLYKQNVIYFVFHDGELGQISQFQKVPLNRKTATTIGPLNIKGVADACGARFYSIANDVAIDKIMTEIFTASEETKLPIIVDVAIDYSKKTFMTKGVIKTNLSRFPFNEKFRFISRALKRQILG